MQTGQSPGTLAVGDLDGDGELEVVVASRAGWLFAWHADAPRDTAAGWVTFGHDVARTHNYAVTLAGYALFLDWCVRRLDRDNAGFDGNFPVAALLIVGALVFAWRSPKSTAAG